MGNKLSMTHASLTASCDSDTKLHQSAMKMEYCPIAAEAGDPRDWLPTEVTMSKLDLLLPPSEESPPGDNVQVEQPGSSTKLSLPMTPFSFKRSRGQHPDGPLCLLPPTLIPHSTASSTTPTWRPLSKMARGDPYSISRSTSSFSKKHLSPWYPQVKTSEAKTNLSRKRTRSLSSAATELIKRSKESIMGRAFRRNPASDTLVPKLLSPVLEPIPAAEPIMAEAKGTKSDKGKSRKKDDKKREASSSSYSYEYSSSTSSTSSSSSGSDSSTSPTSYSYSSSTKKSSYDTSTSSTTKSSSSPSSKSKESKKPPTPVAKTKPPVVRKPPPVAKKPPPVIKKPTPVVKKPPPPAKKPPPPPSSSTSTVPTTTTTSYKSPTATSSTKPSDKTKTTSSYSNSVGSSESPAPQKPVYQPKPKVYSAYGSRSGAGTRNGPGNRKIPPPPVFIGNYGGSSSGIKKTKTPADRLQNVDIVEELCYSCPGDPCSSCTCTCDYYSCCNDCGQYTLMPCCSCTPDKNPVKYCRRQRFNFDDGKEKGDPCEGPPFRCPCPTNPYDNIPVGKNPTAEAVACAINTSKGCDPSDCGEVLPSESGTYFYDANRRCFVPVVEVKGPETPKKEIVDEIIEDEPVLTNIEPIIQPVLDENCCGGGFGGPFGPIQPPCCGTLGGSFMASGLPGCAPTGGLGPKCSDNLGMKALGGMNMPGLANMGPYGSIAVPQFNYVPPPPPPGAPNCPCPPCCPQGPCAPCPPGQPCINGPICFPGYPFPMCPPGMGGTGKKKKNKKGKKGKGSSGYANTASGQSKAYNDQATYDYGTAPTPDYSGSGSGYSGTLLSYE